MKTTNHAIRLCYKIDLLSLVDVLFRIIGILAFLVLIMILPNTVEATHNQNLYVSAENSRFNNHFAGSMVIEVVVQDPNIGTLDDGLGEPSVTLNGKKLRMRSEEHTSELQVT